MPPHLPPNFQLNVANYVKNNFLCAHIMPISSVSKIQTSVKREVLSAGK